MNFVTNLGLSLRSKMRGSECEKLIEQLVEEKCLLLVSCYVVCYVCVCVIIIINGLILIYFIVAAG